MKNTKSKKRVKQLTKLQNLRRELASEIDFKNTRIAKIEEDSGNRILYLEEEISKLKTKMNL